MMKFTLLDTIKSILFMTLGMPINLYRWLIVPGAERLNYEVERMKAYGFDLDYLFTALGYIGQIIIACIFIICNLVLLISVVLAVFFKVVDIINFIKGRACTSKN